MNGASELDGPRGLRTTIFDGLLVGVAIVWCALHLIALLTFGYGRDQGIYAYVARTILEGGMPYRDAWDFKPPGIFLTYAAARVLFGAPMWGIRIVEAVGLVATGAALARIAQVWWSNWRIGLLAAAIAITVHVQLDFWHTAQPESFGGMLLVFGLLVAQRGGDARLLCAGVLFGAAGLFKPPLAGVGAVVAAWKLYERQSSERARGWRLVSPVVIIAVGGAVPILGCLAWLIAGGALDQTRAIFSVFVPRYTELGWQNANLQSLVHDAFGQWLVHFSTTVTIGIAVLLGLRPVARERVAVFVLLGGISVQLIGVALQAKFFDYHFGSVWPFTGLLAALGWWKLWEWARVRGVLWSLAVLVLFGIAATARTATGKDQRGTAWERLGARLRIVFGEIPAAERDELDSIFLTDGKPMMYTGAVRYVGEALQQLVPPNRPIFVWGFEPVIYDVAARRSSSRYFYNEAQRLAITAEPARAELMADLRRDPPAAIVVVRRDAAPEVMGNGLDSGGELREFTEFNAFLDAGYYDLVILLTPI